MVRALEQAIAELARLPATEQERIAGELLAHLDKVKSLRADIEAGLRSLDAGEGRELSIDDLIDQARSRNGDQ
ncbi:MAG: hypothetical protein HXX10_21075 [Rhodoplanes sp.]|uniref:hypothetical protein n=1 Tax=Rhodoplanes sp. TaxID=1968906 RepID=UPI0017ACE80D|nr:hypothetical protein [Rhodoplanes sp.]NVO16528.1 hypothetical protein [Rhodoplanes sp.]